MGKHLDLDDVAATSELATKELAELRSALAKLNALCGNLASAWFYGGWIAETNNEREMQEIMEQLGWWPVESEDKLIATINAPAQLDGAHAEEHAHPASDADNAIYQSIARNYTAQAGDEGKGPHNV